MTRKLSLLSMTILAVALHALLFLATAIYLILFGKNDLAAVSWSLTFYYENASKAVAGMMPYRDFPFEYPILSFPLFLVPRLLVSDLNSYKVAFVLEMLAFDAAAIDLVARFVRDREGLEQVPGRLGWYTLFCASLSPLVIGRFELAPMVLAFAAACWWYSGRQVLGGFAAGLGVLVKVFPGAVAAPALVMEAARFRASRMRGTLTFLATVVVGLAAWFGLGGVRAIHSLGYHAEHGLEIESIYGGGLLLYGLFTGTKIPWEFSYKAYHIAPAWGAGLAHLAMPLQAAALLFIMWRFRRSGMSDGMRFSAAAITAFIVTGKVLSPQYLIWLFPFLAVLGGQRGSMARRVFLVCCLATAFLYPGPGFVMALGGEPGAIMLLNVRNGLLVWVLEVLLHDSRPDRKPH